MIEKITAILETHLDKNLYEYGFADLHGLLSVKYSQYHSGISILRKLDDRIIDAIAEGPTEEYHAHYTLINKELNSAVKILSDEINAAGIQCLPVKATVDDSELDDAYVKTLTYSVSHKMIATRSGLGWIGKTDLLVSKRFGPRIRLASLLLSCKMPGAADPVESSLCGGCLICVENCPAKAASGMLWSVSKKREDFFNPFKCRDYCRKISKELLNRNMSLCGKCMSVCPRGKLSK